MKRDDWLSKVVLKDCYVLEGNEVVNLQENTLSANSFYTCRVLGETLNLQCSLSNLGFRFVISEVELLGTTRAEKQLLPGCSIRGALPGDQSYVEDIASSSFRFDRFHSDHMIESSQADLIKRLWVMEFFRRASTKDLWIAEYKGAVAGFCLAQQSQERVHIDLIAVAQAVQGVGVGTALVKSLPACYGEDSIFIQVGTQERNHQSIQLYVKCGMKINQKRSVYHRGFF